MNRIEKKFAELKKAGRKGLVTFITGGDPNFEKSLSLLQDLPENGADFIEIGMPFSDPMADGPTIQASSLRALRAGMSTEKILDMVRRFRTQDKDTPIILMGYYNPIYRYGPESFIQQAVEAGVDGLIIVDLPPEEYAELQLYVRKTDLTIIRLVTPTTDAARLPAILDGASGFLYYVSITGITGTKSADAEAVKKHIEEIKKETDLPIVVGFGIKDADDVKTMSAFADGVVVGSAIVENIFKHHNDNNLQDIVASQVKDLAGALTS